MYLSTFLFYPLLFLFSLPSLWLFAGREERACFFRLLGASLLAAVVWIVLFGWIEHVPYSHIAAYQVFFYYLLLDHQGFLGIILCALPVFLLKRSRKASPAALRASAVLLGVNIIFAITQARRLEIPNSFMELLTPFLLNLIIVLLLTSWSLFKSEKKQWMFAGITLLAVGICNAALNTLLFFFNPLHCLSILAFIAAVVLLFYGIKKQFLRVPPSWNNKIS